MSAKGGLMMGIIGGYSLQPARESHYSNIIIAAIKSTINSIVAGRAGNGSKGINAIVEENLIHAQIPNANPLAISSSPPESVDSTQSSGTLLPLIIAFVFPLFL